MGQRGWHPHLGQRRDRPGCPEKGVGDPGARRIPGAGSDTQTASRVAASIGHVASKGLGVSWVEKGLLPWADLGLRPSGAAENPASATHGLPARPLTL